MPSLALTRIGKRVLRHGAPATSTASILGTHLSKVVTPQYCHFNLVRPNSCCIIPCAFTNQAIDCTWHFAIIHRAPESRIRLLLRPCFPTLLSLGSLASYLAGTRGVHYIQTCLLLKCRIFRFDTTYHLVDFLSNRDPTSLLLLRYISQSLPFPGSSAR